jgi:uncharacterized protein (TIGR02246 family)
MRKLWIIAALIGSATMVAAQAPTRTPRPGVGGPRTDLQHDTEIRHLFGNFVAAWNHHDPKALAAMWTIDGDHMEPDGKHPRGRAEVGKLLEMEHASVFKNSKLSLDVNTIWFITADVALADADYTLENVVDQAGKPVPTRKGHITAVLLDENNQWHVAASRAMIPVPLVWRQPQGQ